MRFLILHESPGRIRLRADGERMSTQQADLLENWLLKQRDIKQVSVHESTLSVTVHYEMDRDALCRMLAGFSYENAASEVELPSHSSRAMNREYEEKIVFLILSHYAKRLFLPVPFRHVICAIQSMPLILHGLKTLLQRRMTVDVLDGAAIGASLLTGDFSTAASVRFLLRIGETLEEWTHKRSVDNLARSMALQVEQVWRLNGSTQEAVRVSDILPNDLIVVHTGNVLPFDGIIESGDVMINQASLTGESVPAAKFPGTAVYAGSVVEEGNCVIRVTGTVGENRYDRIVRMIEDTERLKSSVESRASNLADRLVPWCFGLSAFTWLLTGNVTRAVSVLMVDFSCALKLSMPLSVLSAMSEAGHHQITVKGGKFMEQLSGADTVIFDKTGTLTHACPTVVRIEAFHGEKADEMLRIAACLEEHFPHSVANAVVRAAKERGLNHNEMHSEVEYVIAHGIATTIDGKRAVIGSAHFVFEDEGVRILPEDMTRFNELTNSLSWLYLSIGGILSAAIGISDPLRPEAAETIEALHENGLKKAVMLTGDNQNTAEVIAMQLGLDEFLAEVLPEDKADYISREQGEGRSVVMIGDGINDTPALSLADVGIAIGSGAMIAREIADITIAAEDLRELVYLKQLSNRLMKRIHNNYRFVIGFNGSLIFLGLLGLLSPAASALLHNTSTVLLSMHSMTELMGEKKTIQGTA